MAPNAHLLVVPHSVSTSFPSLSYLPPSRINSFIQAKTDPPAQNHSQLACVPLWQSRNRPGVRARGQAQDWAPLYPSLGLISPSHTRAPSGSSHPPQKSFLSIPSMGGRSERKRPREPLQQKSGADLGVERSPRISTLFPLLRPRPTCPQHPTKGRPSSEGSELSAALPRNCHTSHQSDCSLFEHFLLFD